MPNPDPVSTAHMARWECYDFLDSQRIGRICIADGDGPMAIPVSFRILGTEAQPFIVIRTSPETKVGRYTGRAAVEADEISEETRRARSVLARGMLHAVRGPHDLPNPQPWIKEDRDRWMMLQVEELTGRRFVARKRRDTFAMTWEPA